MDYVVLLGSPILFHRLAASEGLSPWGWVIASLAVSLLLMWFAEGLFTLLAGQGLLLFAMIGYDKLKSVSG